VAGRSRPGPEGPQAEVRAYALQGDGAPRAALLSYALDYLISAGSQPPKRDLGAGQVMEDAFFVGKPAISRPAGDLLAPADDL